MGEQLICTDTGEHIVTREGQCVPCWTEGREERCSTWRHIREDRA